MLEQKRISVIGGGQMCEAIFSGAVASGVVRPEMVTITDLNEERLVDLATRYGFATLPNDPQNEGAKEAARQGDILVLAIKPQFARAVLEALRDELRPDQLILSIMGGVTLDFLEGFFPENPVVRVMPNTPMLVRKGVAGIAAGKNAQQEHCDLVKELFDLVGISYLLPERLIDPLTSISGCGPAFAYLMIEAMADGGVENGLPREMAIQLAAQTLTGSAEMVLQTGRHPAALKDSVCSPGGSTIAGVHALEDGGFRAAAINAVTKSCERMIEVGKKA
ncbi:pyrroline-5-carboxylate reductase [Anaerotruncus sp. G3(2012)]|uniref:pyrroline-5-carboxylate reductase n=1 Tax=Anaerotruncus sp. G3(2012) TaxID=1235835 RepID=UPI000336EE64|nr:pyrroline-5-carboxylate reductase [Anaerotruncus sp. G3(2012)]EOS56744.1 pyrroline-5-carboxylate reductase [Anaerotruncus sp. G3(2012)]